MEIERSALQQEAAAMAASASVAGEDRARTALSARCRLSAQPSGCMYGAVIGVLLCPCAAQTCLVV